jgi:DNA-binding NtrC family response regulator
MAEQSVRLGGLLESMTKQLGTAKLKSLVGSTVGLVERHYIEAALAMTGDNRTAAARVLGISRQSLYIKLARYGIEHESEPDDTA